VGVVPEVGVVEDEVAGSVTCAAMVDVGLLVAPHPVMNAEAVENAAKIIVLRKRALGDRCIQPPKELRGG
jgi:hypothetical protein